MQFYVNSAKSIVFVFIFVQRIYMVVSVRIFNLHLFSYAYYLQARCLAKLLWLQIIPIPTQPPLKVHQKYPFSSLL